MISVKRITSIEYYEAQDRKALADRPSSDRQAGRDEVAYYTDNGQAESAGVWWTRSTPTPSPSPLFPSSPFAETGTEVDGRHLRDLAAGRHAKTKEHLTRTSANGKRSVGFDIQIAAPKSLSVIVAAHEGEERERYLEAHDRAMRRVLDAAFDMGLVVAHRAVRDPVTRKKSYYEEPVQSATAAIYRHFTSRAKDPHLHSHAILMNVGVRKDGTTGALDNIRLKQYGGMLSALYRAEISSILREEFGIETVRDGRNFEVVGVPESVVKVFSKRRAQIEAVARDEGFNTANARGKAQVASYETRAEKDREISTAELDARWSRELAAFGLDRNSLLRNVDVESRHVRAGMVGQDRDQLVRQAAEKAVHDLTRNNSVIDDRLLMRHVVEAVQTLCNADKALAAVEAMKASGLLVQIGMVDERAVYSTKAIIEAERSMLRTGVDRKGEREFVPEDAIRAAIARRPTMREDQAAAVLHALNRDGVAVVEGSAGSGKSFSLGAVAEVARECGLTAWTIAPSWKATEVVRSDTQTAEAYARAVQGFVRQVQSGKIMLDAKSVVIVDEAGMVGTEDMSILVEATAMAGAKLILTGDTRQLQPVVAGSPMKAIARFVGSERMTEITRQRADWMKAASQDLAVGETVPALEAYAKAGAVVIGEDRDATLRQLVEDYAKARQERPDATRCILAGWNQDVRALNEAIREAGKKAGWIEAEDTVVQAIPRGGDKPHDLALAVGDDLIFGETIELGTVTIRNADLARVLGVRGSPPDPVLDLDLGRGRRIAVPLSHLVGRREDGEPLVPRLQHACAMTIHASQGVTVDEAYVANLRGMGMESTYVAMTRHRERVRLYADGGRIVDEIAARDGAAIRQSKGGKTVLPEEEDDRAEVEITPEKIRERLFAETMKADQKQNASDYFDVGTFMRKAAATPVPVVETVERNEARPRVGLEAALTRMGGLGGAGWLKQPAAAPSKLAERMAAREAAKTHYPIPEKPARSRVTPDEIDQFVRSDLLEFAVRDLGGSLVERWSNGGAVRFGDIKNGEKIGITRKANGVWNWTLSNGGASGVIQTLVQHVKGHSYAEALHWLRDRFRTQRETRPLETVRSERDVTGDGDRAKVMAGWQALRQSGVSRWLTKERGIAPEIVERFAADIKADWTGDRASNRFGAAFAHRTPDGDLVNYVRRGAPQAGKVESFRANSAGGAPTLFMAGDRKPSRVYVTESSVDTLSLYQIDGAPQGAMLTAPDGTPGRRSLDALAEIARRNPGAEWHVGLDNDAKGREFAARVREAIRSGNPDAILCDRSPDQQFKDWNGALNGITGEQEKAAKTAREKLVAEHCERVEQEARTEQIRQEEARRKREEKARQEAKTARRNDLSGPRMR